MKYLGMEFEDAQEVREWSKQGNIDHYRKLVKRFAKAPSMERQLPCPTWPISLSSASG